MAHDAPTLPAVADPNDTDDSSAWTTLNLYRRALADELERHATGLLGLSARLRTDGTDESLLAAVTASLASRPLAELAGRHHVAFQTWLATGLPAGHQPPPIPHMPALTADGIPALLTLHRQHDPSGVSGTGTVALVTIYPQIPGPQGPVVVRWRGHHSHIWSDTRYTSPVQLRLHAHHGHTTAVWLLRPRWVDELTDPQWTPLQHIT